MHAFMASWEREESSQDAAEQSFDTNWLGMHPAPLLGRHARQRDASETPRPVHWLTRMYPLLQVVALQVLHSVVSLVELPYLKRGQ